MSSWLRHLFSMLPARLSLRTHGGELRGTMCQIQAHTQNADLLLTQQRSVPYDAHKRLFVVKKEVKRSSS